MKARVWDGKNLLLTWVLFCVSRSLKFWFGGGSIITNGVTDLYDPVPDCEKSSHNAFKKPPTGKACVKLCHLCFVLFLFLCLQVDYLDFSFLPMREECLHVYLSNIRPSTELTWTVPHCTAAPWGGGTAPCMTGHPRLKFFVMTMVT